MTHDFELLYHAEGAPFEIRAVSERAAELMQRHCGVQSMVREDAGRLAQFITDISASKMVLVCKHSLSGRV